MIGSEADGGCSVGPAVRVYLGNSRIGDLSIIDAGDLSLSAISPTLSPVFGLTIRAEGMLDAVPNAFFKGEAAEKHAVCVDSCQY